MIEPREHKYRAWDKKLNIMIDSSYGDWISFDGVPYTEATNLHNTPNIEIQKEKDYILMQYVGLIDKYKTKVFEGDILENPKGERGLVVYYEAGFALEGKRKNNSVVYIPLTQGFLNNKTIIGNLFQNPEKLEKK